MFKTIANAFRDKDIRKRIFLTLLMLFIYRIGCFIPIPGLDIATLETTMNGNDFFNIIGSINGSLQQGTLFALGIMPFINAFIIMQLLTLIIPKLERMSKEGEAGRKKITQITRYVAIALAIVQAFGFVLSWGDNAFIGMFAPQDAGARWATKILAVIILVAGSTFVMWLGERITEYGIGNGTSLIIFIGVLSTLGDSIITAIRTMAGQDSDQLMGSIWFFIGFIVFVLLLFFFITFIDLSERRISVRYAKQVKGNKMYGGQNSHIPMKVNASGVMPIIFASSFLMFPQMIASFWPESAFYQFWAKWLGVGSYVYAIVMSLLILFFAYFYAQIQFNPMDVARNIQQYGGFIPGIRPGKPTSDYLAKINNRITFFGAIFLAIIALIPSILQATANLSSDLASLGLTGAFSATGLLIVVSVALEFNKQLESQIMMKTYKGFLK